MTLIAAFRCKDDWGNDAFVVSAESQETQGDYRFYLEKLEPIKTGNFVLVIGGSGYGDLVDAFHLRLMEILPSASATTMPELKKIIQAELLDFIQVEVAAFAAPKRDKYVRFLIGAFSRANGECESWLTRSAQLKPVKNFELIGIESAFYKDIAARMHSVEAGIGRTVRLSLYLLMVAKRTANFADGPTSLFVISKSGIWAEPKDFIDEAEQHIFELNSASDELFVELPDLSLSAVEFEATLQDFLEKTRSIRAKYVKSAANTILAQLQQGEMTSEPYRKFPESGSFTLARNDGKLSVGQIGDNPNIGRHIGRFDEQTGGFISQHNTIRFCGKKRVIGNRVFAQVVPCKHRHHQTPSENCISDKWLETLEANYSDDSDRTQ